MIQDTPISIEAGSIVCPEEWIMGGPLVADADFGMRLSGAFCDYPVRVTHSGARVTPAPMGGFRQRVRIDFLNDDGDVSSTT